MNLYVKSKTEVDYKKVSFEKIGLFVIALSVIVYILFSSFSPQITHIVEKIPILLSKDSNKFSQEKLKLKLKTLKLQHPEIIYAQALLESNNFKSNIFKQNNNLFGMKVASTRPTTALGLQLNHAYYSSWEESLIDYSLWQASFARNLTQEEYLNLLDRMYAEDKTYKKKLIKLIPIYLKK